MGFFDFFSNLTNKFGINSKNSIKSQYRVESLRTSVWGLDTLKTSNKPNSINTSNTNNIGTITIERDLHVGRALSGLQTAKTKQIKITTPRTLKLEHGKSFIRLGVHIEPTEAFQLNYKGLLAQSGAKDIVAVVGYGSNDNWRDIQRINMTRTGHRNFCGYVPIKGKRINIAFTDGSGAHWDNNSGNNYCFNKELLLGAGEPSNNSLKKRIKNNSQVS